MLRKLKEEEGQQKLHAYISPQTTSASNRHSSSTVKKRTPPSIEKQSNKKVLVEDNMMEGETTEPPTQNLVDKLTTDQDPTTEEGDRKLIKKIVGSNNEDEDEEEELPRKTINCMKKALQELITPIENKVNQLLTIKNNQDVQTEEINNLKVQQSELYRRCLKVELENNKLKKQLEQLENKQLESNLIMHGLREDEWEKNENRLDRIYRAISSTIDVEDRRERLNIARSIPIRSTRRIGKYRTGKNRPISICFKKKAHADTLFKSKGWLPRGVYVDREYTDEVENQRKLLRPILKLARSIECYQGKCKLEDNYLVILGKKYYTSDLGNLPSDLSSFHASSNTENPNVHAFFGELTPFSNFHPASFNVKGTQYFCSEQYIQEQKALLFKDKNTADKIMISSTALECKEYGKQVKGYKEDIWKEQAEQLCTPGILAKFQSHQCLADMLQSTGNQQIVEATYDTMWGTGIPLHHKDCSNPRYWKGQGLLGTILMYVCRKLKESSKMVEHMDTGDPTIPRGNSQRMESRL